MKLKSAMQYDDRETPNPVLLHYLVCDALKSLPPFYFFEVEQIRTTPQSFHRIFFARRGKFMETLKN